MSWRVHSRAGHGLSLWALLLGCLSTEGQWAGPGVDGEFLDTSLVSAVTGGDAALPCNTRSPQSSDLLLLVVWYKDDVPVYSFDGRKIGPAANWADESLSGRTEWHAADPSTLLIRNIVPEDRGLYRCRVDFKISPTINQKILLDVIELPSKPKVFDERDKEMIKFAGPYVEDTSTKLTCVVSGGKPMPRLRWWRDDKVLSTLPPADDGSQISLLDLRIPKLTRDYNGAVYTCTADNTALVSPLRTSVQLQMYLRPLTVEILTREQPLSVQQTAELACRAVGARPPAVITWWLDNEKFNSAVQKDLENENETLSILRWTPFMKNNGQTLTCRASHAVLKHTTIDTSLLLNLHYAPIVVLKLGSELNPGDIEEGDDVYFVCVVQAYPPAYKVVWEHNGQVIIHNQRAGVIAGSGHLAIQGVSREQAGTYSCTASNVEGDGTSIPYDLKIIYKPVCKMASMAIVGVAINEETKITCEVDAFPRPESFQWTLNNSIGTIEFDAENMTTSIHGKSILSFTPKSEADYGIVSCRASNTGGQQVEPCRFTIHRPYNCSTLNMTDDSVELQCVVGYNGGLHTSYCVEAWEAGNLVLNVSTTTPIWKLRGLGSGKTLKLVFYAYNSKGRTEITTLRVHTLSRLALHTEAKSTNFGLDLNWTIKWLAGLSCVLLLVMVVWRITLSIMVRNIRDQPMQYAAPMQIMKVYSSGNHSPLQPDDKNPDVVPLEKGLNYKEDSESFPEPLRYGVTSPLVGNSKSNNSLQREIRSNAHTPNTPASDAQSIGTLGDDRRSVTSGTLSRRREIVTTRTPLLENTRESYV